MDSLEKEILSIVRKALELSARDRGPFLDARCGQDGDLRVRVEEILAWEESGKETGTAVRGEPAGDVRRVGPYVVLEELGAGGMGTVYLAEQRKPVYKRVALKVMRGGLDTADLLARFEAEQKTLALMDHPGIAHVFDAGSTSDGRPYFAMEYVPGVDVITYCDQHRLTIDNRLELFSQVCQAVQHAHLKGIIHRDLKPSNILVICPDNRPVAKVIDFGLAKVSSQRLTEHSVYTQFGAIVGTLKYMSPEQTRTTVEVLDHRTDVYSLGVLLYELVVGELPLDWEPQAKASLEEILRRIREEEAIPPFVRWSRLNRSRMQELAEKRRSDTTSVGRTLRSDLQWITQRAMEKDRQSRYASASELAADIARYQKNEPLSVGPPSFIYTLRKYIRKNRIAVAAYLAMFLIMLLGILGSLMFFRSERNARLVAEKATQLERLAYVTCVKSAALDLERGNVAEARRQLESYEETLGKYRGWEWHHLWLASDLSRKTRALDETEREASRTRVTSPDESTRARAVNKVVRLTDAKTGKTLGQLEGHAERVTAMTFGRHEGGTAVSPKTRLATGSRDSIRLWDLAARKVLTVIPNPHAPHHIHCLRFSNDGTRLASGVDSLLVIHDLTGDGEPLELHGHTKWIASVAFRADDERVLSGSFDKTVRLWDATTGELLATLRGHGHGVFHVSYDSHGEIVSASHDGFRKTWDPNVWGASIPLTGHRKQVCSLAIRPDGAHIASGDSEGRLLVWEAKTGKLVSGWEKKYDGELCAIHYTPNDECLVIASLKKVQVWDCERERVVAQLEPPDRRDHFYAMAVGPDSRRLAVGLRSGTILLWDFGADTTPIVLCEKPYPGSTSEEKISSLAFCTDGQTLISGSWNKTVCVWNLTSRTETATLGGHEGPIESVAVHPMENRAVSGSQDNTLKIWEQRDGSWMNTTTCFGHDGNVFSVGYSPNGKRVVSGSQDGTVRVWDPETGTLLATLRLDAGRGESKIRCVAFSPDGQRVITGAYGETRIWESVMSGLQGVWQGVATR